MCESVKILPNERNSCQRFRADVAEALLTAGQLCERQASGSVTSAAVAQVVEQ